MPTATTLRRFGLAALGGMGLGLGLPIAVLEVHGTNATQAASETTMEVFKSPTCSCCSAWIDHAAKSGFTSKVRDLPSSALQGLKDKIGLKPDQRSCHTALLGGYVIEGHVPADDVKRLLAEKPDAIGLAVPGMPVGSPGMEGDTVEPYDVLLVKRDGSTTVFASH